VCHAAIRERLPRIAVEIANGSLGLAAQVSLLG
jgi:hypothetical protein